MYQIINCAEAPTILQSCFFMNIIWPFVLTFAMTFGVLFKTKIFGENKNQLNAIIAAVIAIIFVSFAYYVQIVQFLLAFMVVGLIILLVFMMMFGFIHKEGEFKLESGVVKTIGYLIALSVVGAVMYITGAWAFLMNYFTNESGSKWIGTVIMIVVVVGAIAAVMAGSGSSEKK